VSLEEKIVHLVLKKVAEVAKERNLDEEGINTYVETVVRTASTEGVKYMADEMTAYLARQIPEMIEQERTLRTAFEQRLYERWQKALDLFDATVILTREAGERFLTKYREQTVKENATLIEALVRIHVRACQTASAISVLLKSGFARDALARQRTLHEFAVVTFLLKKHGGSLAERFLLHERIETAAAAEQYEQFYARLGEEPPDPANVVALRAEKARLCQQFGEDFKNHYGWAAQVLGVKRPKFEDLEKAVRLDHLRPYYRMASYGVHATPKGIVFDVGTIQDLAGGPRGLLAGASNAGLADAGHASLLSLGQCTAALLTSRPDLEAVAELRMLKSFVDEAGQEFIRIHREQIQEEKQRLAALSEPEDEQNESLSETASSTD